MASLSVPCPKISIAARNGSSSHQIRINPSAPSSASFLGSSKKQSASWKLQAKVNEMTAEKASNCAPLVDTKPKDTSLNGNVEPTDPVIPDSSSISAFMAQVSDLVKLVDSRDITELQMKQADCELIIRKKEALQPPAPTIQMPTAMPNPMYMSLPPPMAPPAAPAPAPASPSSAAPPRALPAPAKTSTSSHPPLKCPMAGTFYRSPAPGEPPFIKVGDKVQKGQVVCIIEAMKLMNEIEADQSGTVTEILVEDGKPVSVDLPLLLIAP